MAPNPRGEPEPQKWNDERGTVVGDRSRVTPLAEYTLPANQEGMTLAQLAEIYPAPKEPVR